MEELISKLEARLATAEGQMEELIYEIRHLVTSLAPVISLAAAMLKEKTGAKEVKVTAIVRGENAGGPMLHLYTDHPEVLRRVGRVYAEHFAELEAIGINVFAAPLYTGEGAPSREHAAKVGVLYPVKPFIAAFVPTGKQTDNGQAIYRWDRILTTDVPVYGGNGNGHAEETAAAQPATVKTDPKTAAASAAPAAKAQPAPVAAAPDHIVFGSSRDAAEWAVGQGVFPDTDMALDAFTKLWRAHGAPKDAKTFYPVWEDHVAGLVKEAAAAQKKAKKP